MHPALFRIARFVGAATLLVAGSASAADVCYQGGPLLPNFQLNGDARLDGTALVVTEALSTQRGSISYLPKFSTSSDVHILMKVVITTPEGTLGADGLAFVMHNHPDGPAVMGEGGGGVGYGGIEPSIAVEFDTYQNANENDNHVAITRDGVTLHTDPRNAGLPYNANPGVTLKSGTPVFLWMDYVQATKAIRVYMATTEVKPGAATLSATVDLGAELGADFFMTFTASTGGAWSKHEVQELYASDVFADPKEGCCATNADCAANQVCDPVKHLCGECTLADDGACGPLTPACSLASSANSCVTACTGDVGSGTTVPCGTAFPACRPDGQCASCNGDATTLTSVTCDGGAPFCSPSGYCGRCTSNADCTTAGVTHAGSICDANTGGCRSCVLDAECGAGEICRDEVCFPRAANGEPVPGGECNPGTADRCLTGVCNPADDLCGSTIGGACFDAADCRAGECVAAGPNANTCRECATAASCSGTTPVCGAANACVACNGDQGSGATAACVSSAAATCLPTGACVPCTSNAQCAGAGHAGGICNLDLGICGTACAVDSDCGADWCDNPSGQAGGGTCSSRLTNGQPIPAAAPLGGVCTPEVGLRVCESRTCSTVDNSCGLRVGDTCDVDDCRAPTLCLTEGPNAGTCRACASADECATTTPVCGADNACIACTGDFGSGAAAACASSSRSTCFPDGTCAPCTSNTECVGAGHAGTICNLAVGSCGTACAIDSDCGAGWCDNPTAAPGAGTCTPRIGNGSPIPASIGGLCSDETGERVCESRTCGADNLCGRATAASCTDANDCRVGLCLTEGPNAGTCRACGEATDCGSTTPVCDASNACVGCSGDFGGGSALACPGSAAATCLESGACAPCTTNTECVGAGHAGPICNLELGTCGTACSIDGDCGDGWCDNPAMTSGGGVCTPRISNGEPIPSVEPLAGECNDESGSRVCLARVCDEADDRCGLGLGGACTTEDECRSGHCATASGSCVQCTQDSHCPAGDTCDTSNGTCGRTPPPPPPSDGGTSSSSSSSGSGSGTSSGGGSSGSAAGPGSNGRDLGIDGLMGGGCSTSGTPGGSSAGWLLGLALVARRGLRRRSSAA